MTSTSAIFCVHAHGHFLGGRSAGAPAVVGVLLPYPTAAWTGGGGVSQGSRSMLSTAAPLVQLLRSVEVGWS